MTDTVTRLMALADEYMTQEREGVNGYEARQALEDELQKLFTPLSDEQIAVLQFENLGKTMWFASIVRAIEHQHGIGEAK